MQKPLTLVSAVVLFIFLFLLQTNFSACKKDTQIVTDTVRLTVRDTVVVTDTIPPINLQSGLIAYYPFSNNAKDSSGNNNNGLVVGNLQYTTDMNSKAASAALFDGSTSYITVNDNGTLSPTSITISVQFYENSTAHQNLISKINFADATSPCWGIAPFGATSSNPTAIGFTALGPAVACGSPETITGDELVYSVDSIKTGRWYQLTCTFDKGIEKLYLNGVLKSALTRNYTTLKQCTAAQMEIGAFWSGGMFLYSGKMDELRIYNRALNDREIQTLAKGF